MRSLFFVCLLLQMMLSSANDVVSPLCNDELNLRYQEMAQPLENVVVPRMLLLPLPVLK
jgi:hypothetical protein